MRRTAVAVLVALAAQVALVEQGSGPAFAADTSSVTKVTKATKAKPSPAKATGPAEAQDEASAVLMARLQHRKIEVLSARTADSSTYALPDGQLQTQAFAGPVRTKVDGVWKDIDTSLSDTGADLTRVRLPPVVPVRRPARPAQRLAPLRTYRRPDVRLGDQRRGHRPRLLAHERPGDQLPPDLLGTRLTGTDTTGPPPP